jgi:hypothetical protein
MNIGDQDFERAMAAIDRMVGEVGPRRPTIAKGGRATRRQREILDLIASYAHRQEQDD